MKKLLNLAIYMPLLLLSACDVHEWPEITEYVKLHLRLNYETDMTKWEHLYDGTSAVGQEPGEIYDNRLEHGSIRYIVRTYPISGNQSVMHKHRQEFVFTKDMADGYAHEMTLDVLPGDYRIMVWSDLAKTNGDTRFYNAGNFAEIMLQGDHKANTDYRDAFKGSNNISLKADITERLPDTLDIVMQRPLAKFEFVANDVVKFVEKEVARIASKAGTVSVGDVNLKDYRVVFKYVGFMPNAYSMFASKPVDSSNGVMFESTLTKLTDSEASMGFDYVFVNGDKLNVTVQVGIYDKENTQLSMSNPIEVPLKQSRHTIVRGMFLTLEPPGPSKPSEGVIINPNFDNEYNLIFP